MKEQQNRVCGPQCIPILSVCYCYIGKLLTLTRSIKHPNVSFEIYIPVIHSKTALNARSSHTSEVIALTLELKHLI